MTVTLQPSAAIFTVTNFTAPLTTSPAVMVTLQALDPQSLKPTGGTLTPRPGANLAVSLKTSDAKIVQIPSGALTLGATGSQSITLQPASIGTALLSLGALPGSPSPASGGQLVVNVTAQALTLADFKLGATEQVPVRFLLADDQPTPSSPLFIYPVVSDGKLLQLSTDVKSFGSNQIQLMIPAGTRFSNPLWVQALSDTGKPQIRVDFQGATYSTTVTLDKPAFVFAEANGSNTMLPELLGTSPVNLKVVPAVSPDGSPLLTPAITPGAAMRTLTVSSSNPSVAQVVTSTVTFAPGDTQKAVQVRLLATGTATISLGGDASAYLGTLLSKVTLVVK